MQTRNESINKMRVYDEILHLQHVNSEVTRPNKRFYEISLQLHFSTLTEGYVVSNMINESLLYGLNFITALTSKTLSKKRKRKILKCTPLLTVPNRVNYGPQTNVE
ncbi:hypothetical protein J6590_078501 [Homalodisca vitripennis]|nr:hypothetical protein J6590_078501 [Homalodisca vitripennis]